MFFHKKNLMQHTTTSRHYSLLLTLFCCSENQLGYNMRTKPKGLSPKKIGLFKPLANISKKPAAKRPVSQRHICAAIDAFWSDIRVLFSHPLHHSTPSQSSIASEFAWHGSEWWCPHLLFCTTNAAMSLCGTLAEFRHKSKDQKAV